MVNGSFQTAESKRSLHLSFGGSVGGLVGSGLEADVEVDETADLVVV